MTHSIQTGYWQGAMLAALLCTGLAQAQTVERPNIQVGDRWKYETTDSLTNLVSSQMERIITAVNESQIEGTENGSPARYTPDMNPMETPEFRFDPAAAGLRFPFREGDKWRYEGRVTNKATGMTSDNKYEVKVVSQEKISVPGGTFNTYKLVLDGYSTSNPGITSGRTTAFTRTLWYAPALKAFIRLEQVAGRLGWRMELIETSIKP